MINSNTKALMIPNLLGNLLNWKKLREIANKYHLIMIEDSADTLGATIDGLPVSRYREFTYEIHTKFFSQYQDWFILPLKYLLSNLWELAHEIN